MKREKKAAIILEAIDKRMPTCNWSQADVWQQAIMRGLYDIEKMEVEEQRSGNRYGLEEEYWKEFCRLAAGVAMDPWYLITQMISDLVDEDRVGHKDSEQWFNHWKRDTYADTSFVAYLFLIGGGPEDVLKLHDNIQDALYDLEHNEADVQIDIREEIKEYMDQIRAWYRHYFDYYGAKRADKTLEEAMGRLITWRARCRAQGQKNERASWIV